MTTWTNKEIEIGAGYPYNEVTNVYNTILLAYNSLGTGGTSWTYETTN